MADKRKQLTNAEKRHLSEDATIIPGPPSPELARQLKAQQIAQGTDESNLLEPPYDVDQPSEE